MEPEKWVIKAQLGADLRRWSTSRACLSYRRLIEDVLQAFGPALDSTSATIKYKDSDGDLITIACQDDLDEALGGSQSPLRLQVSSTAPQGVPIAYGVPQARFVSHVTIPDDTQCVPGQEFIKSWRLRNTGPCRWPEGTRLIHVGGALFRGECEVLVPSLEPNEETEVSVSLLAPEAPGHYVCYWRLASPVPREKRFGQRIWLQIRVPSREGAESPECECEHLGVRCHCCGAGCIAGVRWRGRRGQDDLCALHFKQLPKPEQQMYDCVLGAHPRTLAAVLKSPLRTPTEQLLPRLQQPQLDALLHALEPLFCSIPKPLVDAALSVVRPFVAAMAHVDDRTISTLQGHLQATVLSLIAHSGQLSKTHGRPGNLLQKALALVSRTVADQGSSSGVCEMLCRAGPAKRSGARGAEQDQGDDNVLRVNAWLLQEMGFAEDDALAALIGAEGVVEDAIDLVSGFEEASP